MGPDRPEDPGADAPPPPGAGPRRPPGPTRRELVDGVERELSEAGLESARTEAERLVAAALGVDRHELSTASATRVDAEEAARVASALGRRLSREPLQHIEGSVEFRGLILVSDDRALIPRPETEQLIDLLDRRIPRYSRPVRALEIGVGSGAIALSLLEEGLASEVVGLDVSERALEQAAENASGRGEPGRRLTLRRCPPEIWPALEGEAPFGLVVSNPPYVASAEIRRLASEVRDHEPREALDGGPAGLDVIASVVRGAHRVLAPDGLLALEIGAGQGTEVRELLERAGRWASIRIETDLAGRPRFATARHVFRPDPA